MRQVLLITALVCGFAAPGLAEDTQTVVPASPAQIQLSFAPIVKRVTPAVVNVYAQRVEQNRQNPMFDDPLFQEFFGGGQAAPRERVERSLGSGVIVEAGGLIVTNFHVIDNATEVKVALYDKREFAADIVLRDQRADLAVLKLKGVKEPLATLEFADSDTVQVGDLVLAVGDPFGVGQTVTSGIVSALARSQVGKSDFQSFIQTDAAINPGNSGGALVDMAGKLVGINTAIVSRSGGSIGIGFAIPAAMVRVVVDSAKAGSAHVLRPWLGASLQGVTAEIAESMSLDRPNGALVAQVQKGGPAEAAGLATGDIITSVDGVTISDPEEFGYRFATKPLGGTTVLDVLRGGSHRPVTIALTPAAQTTPADETAVTGSSPLTGLTVVNLSPAIAEELGIALDASGVIVKDVAQGSAAARFGFQKKDLLVALNGQEVTSAKAVAELVKSPHSFWRITINRGGRQITTILGG